MEWGKFILVDGGRGRGRGRGPSRGNMGGRAPYMGRGRARAGFNSEGFVPDDAENSGWQARNNFGEAWTERENNPRKRLNYDPASMRKDGAIIKPAPLAITEKEQADDLPVQTDRLNSTPEKVQLPKRTKRNDDVTNNEISATSNEEVDRTQ